MRLVKPIDEPAKPIRACATAALRIHACAATTPVPMLNPPHQCLICCHQAGSVAPVPDPTLKGGGEGVAGIKGRRESATCKVEIAD
jgi:hypothetical protein